MSYSIYLRGARCPHCGAEREGPELPGPTYNLTPIFHFALTGERLGTKFIPCSGGLSLLNGLKAKDTYYWLRLAGERLFDDRLEKTFRGMEPDNKWGSLEDAREVMSKLCASAKEYPDLSWEIR